MQRRRVLTILVVLIATLMAGQVGIASADGPEGVDFTIAETIPVTTGSLDSGSIPGCAAPTVHTENVTATARGSATVFEGEKRFDCGGGNEFTLRFAAVVIGCADADHGLWRVVDGSGAYEGLRGAGSLVGTYQNGDACTADGINDRYRGVLLLP